MNIDPSIVALRSDRALQRRLQIAMEAARDKWFGEAPTAAVIEDLEQYSAGAGLTGLPHLSALVGSHDRATHFVRRWCETMTEAVRLNPLGQVPFRYNCSAGYSAIRLATSGRASLSLLAYEERTDVAEPTSACFVAHDLHEIVLAGSAAGLVHNMERGIPRPISRRVEWSAGDRIVTCGTNETRQVISVSGRFSLLQLAREEAGAPPTREVALDSGRILHRSCGDKRDSQTEMALAVLGAMRRQDAVPAMEAISAGGPPHLRWQAVRHTIALNPQHGFAALLRIAKTPDDELFVPAGELRNQLASAYPQLLEQEFEPCPA